MQGKEIENKFHSTTASYTPVLSNIHHGSVQSSLLFSFDSKIVLVVRGFPWVLPEIVV